MDVNEQTIAEPLSGSNRRRMGVGVIAIGAACFINGDAFCYVILIVEQATCHLTLIWIHHD